MIRPHFNSVKTNYTRKRSVFIKAGGCNYDNTCATRLSSALIKSNPNFKKIFAGASGNKCNLHGNMRGAQDLAKALNASIGVRDIGWHGTGKINSQIIGKKGIICFMSIPGFGGQGHISLWDGKEVVDGGEYWDSKTIYFWRLP